MKLFISWSGKLSKEIGKALKAWLLEDVFHGEVLEIFFSEEDIGYGTDWLHQIRHEVDSCNGAIIVLTEDNLSAPWLNFEAGSIAMSLKESRRTIPFLIDISARGARSARSPLSHFQSVTTSKDDIEKLIRDIKVLGDFSAPTHINDSLARLYNELMIKIESSKASFAEDYSDGRFQLFPDNVKKLKKGKVFVGVPMASVDDRAYAEYKDCALRVKTALLEHAGAKEVYCPSEAIPDRGKFEGYKKAILKDFQVLKESEHYVFIYPEKLVTSILIEIGYAIALSKNMTIFTRSKDDLPFMLKKADTVIPNLEIYQYRETGDIIEMIAREGDAFLKRSRVGYGE